MDWSTHVHYWVQWKASALASRYTYPRTLRSMPRLYKATLLAIDRYLVFYINFKVISYFRIIEDLKQKSLNNSIAQE